MIQHLLHRIYSNRLGLLLAVIFTFATFTTQAQDPAFSQFYANPLYLNPAYTGTKPMPKFHINFRDQWPAISHAYVSLSASYDQYVPAINSGFGVLVVGDQAGNGLYQTNIASGLYSYQINLTDAFAIKIGVQGSFAQKRLGMDKIFFYDQIDPVTGFYDSGNNLNPTGETSQFESSITYADFSGGMLAFSKRLFGGVAVKHVTEPNETFTGSVSKIPMRFTVHGGAVLGAEPNSNEGVAVSPNIMFTQQGPFRQLNAGSYLKIQNFFGGMWYRYNIDYSDAVILLLGGQKGIFKAAYSYDFTIRDLQSNSGGAHEISVTIDLSNKEKVNRSTRLSESLQCPGVY